MSERVLCVVPCGKRKIWDKQPTAGPTPARYVYKGGFSESCQRYAQTFYPNEWVILSAKYGYLFPDDIIPGPYNVTFNDPTTHPIRFGELRALAAKLAGSYDKIVVVAGQNYVNAAIASFPGKTICTPLKGVGALGYMKQAINNALIAGVPLLEQCHE